MVGGKIALSVCCVKHEFSSLMLGKMSLDCIKELDLTLGFSLLFSVSIWFFILSKLQGD